MTLKTDSYLTAISMYGHQKHRLTCRLGIFAHGFLECCGNPQCTQECGPSFWKESLSTRSSNSKEKQWMRPKKGRIYSVAIQSNDANAGGLHTNGTTVTTNPTDTDFTSKVQKTRELHAYDENTQKPKARQPL